MAGTLGSFAAKLAVVMSLTWTIGCAFHRAYDYVPVGVDRGWVRFVPCANCPWIQVFDPEYEKRYECDSDCLIAKSPGGHTFAIFSRGGARTDVDLLVERDMVTVVTVNVANDPAGKYATPTGWVHKYKIHMAHTVMPATSRDGIEFSRPGLDVWSYNGGFWTRRRNPLW